MHCRPARALWKSFGHADAVHEMELFLILSISSKHLVKNFFFCLKKEENEVSVNPVQANHSADGLARLAVISRLSSSPSRGRLVA